MLTEIPAISHESWLYFISFPDSRSVCLSIHKSCEIPSRLADTVLGRLLRMSLCWISKPIASCIIEEKTISLSVFYYSLCTFLCCCAVSTYLRSLTLSPFLLSFVAVSRPCRLLEFCPNRALHMPSWNLSDTQKVTCTCWWWTAMTSMETTIFTLK